MRLMDLGLAAMVAIGLLVAGPAGRSGVQAGGAPEPRWRHLTSQRGELPVPPAGNEQTGAIVGDFDRDGICDFMITERTKGPSVVWYRRQVGGWGVYVVDGGRLPLEAGGTCCDVDGDGDLDLLVGEDSSGRNVYWWENPYPHFDPKKPWRRRAVKNSGATKHHDLIVGDFLGTGKPQLVFWNQGARRLWLAEIPEDARATEPWPLVEIYRWDSGQEHEGLASADIDGDGRTDLIGGGRWFKHGGGYRFEAWVIDDTQRFTRAAAGWLKKHARHPQVVFVPGDATGALKWYECQGDPAGGAGWIGHALLERPVVHGHTLQVADIDGDGCLDIFCAEMAQWSRWRAGLDHPGATAWIFYGDGKGGFRRTELVRGMGFHEGKLADLDGDGRLDILHKPYTWEAPRVDVWLQSPRPGQAADRGALR